MGDEEGPPGGPGAVLSFLREGVPSYIAEVPTTVPILEGGHGGNPAHSARCQAFIEWLDARNLDVVVFDMDRTMSRGHCGQGLPRDQIQGYLDGRSHDFVEAAKALSELGRHRLAVATGSDPLEYDLPGQGRDTHILGPDLAAALLDRWCPEARAKFEVMVGYDFELHGGNAHDKGKRYHMRRIAEHYGVEFRQMVLFDDSQGCLENEDGWLGVKVSDSVGFRFEDCFEHHGELPGAPH
mmetsp:Transcript_29088/g.73707  ORF Transcript_29088/g.73707 Transcript_29088/m.73707 type:complete len:239 (-) Transcript_29088:46-762(-)